MIELPVVPGTYALFFHLKQKRWIAIGKSGRFSFPTGYYIYLGSAKGPGGLCARLGRHLRGPGHLHWHVDYLHRFARVIAVSYTIGEGQLECCWSQALAQLPGGQIIVPGFGASDCRSGCPAHLVAFRHLNVDKLQEMINCPIIFLR